MARVVWAREALRNLSSIGEYLDEVAPESRASVLREIVDSTDRLSSFPRSGKMLEGPTGIEIREVVVRAYRIFYSIEDNTVTIAYVFHAAMNVRARLRKLLGEP